MLKSCLKFCHVTCLHFVIREDSDSHRLVRDKAGMRAHLFTFTDEAAEVLLRLTAEPSTDTNHSFYKDLLSGETTGFDSADGCDPEEHLLLLVHSSIDFPVMFHFSINSISDASSQTSSEKLKQTQMSQLLTFP